MADQGSRSRGSSLQADSGSPRTALTDSSPEQESSTQTTGSRGRARGLGRGSPRNPQATTPGPACRPNPNQARIGQQDNESGQYADYVVVEKTDVIDTSEECGVHTPKTSLNTSETSIQGTSSEPPQQLSGRGRGLRIGRGISKSIPTPTPGKLSTTPGQGIFSSPEPGHKTDLKTVPPHLQRYPVDDHENKQSSFKRFPHVSPFQHPTQTHVRPKQINFIPERPTDTCCMRTQNTVLEISGLTSGIDKEHLQLYFESSESNGEDGAVKDCILVPPGSAFVTFFSSDVAEHVLKKPVHQLDDIQLHLKFASEIPEVGDDTSKLIVKNIPEGIHEQHLELFFRLSIKTVTQVDFSFKQVVNNSTVLQLSRQLSHEELDSVVQQIEQDPIDGTSFLTVLKCKAPNSLKVKNITKPRKLSFIKLYFQSHKKSGGGELCSDPVLLAGGKEAVVSFKNPKVIRTVLSKDHKNTFGESVQLDIEDPNLSPPILTKPVPKPAVEPFKFEVKPLLAAAVSKHPNKLRQKLQSFNVQIEIQDDHILITPSENANHDWQSSCTEFITKHFCHIEMEIPGEIMAEMMKQIGKYDQQEVAFANKVASGGCGFILAGDTEVITALKNFQNSLTLKTQETMILTVEQFDFFEQVKKNSIKRDYPDVTIETRSNKECQVFLRGPASRVKQVQEELVNVFEVLRVIPVQLDPKLTEHFATKEGLLQLESFITSHRCPLAHSFICKRLASGRDSQLGLVFVCEPSSYDWASTIPEKLVCDATYDILTVPDLLATELEKISDFQSLCQRLQSDHRARVVFDDFTKKVTVYGFSTAVPAISTELKSLIAEKEKLITPASIPVSQLLCRALNTRPTQLQKVLSDNCPTKVTLKLSEDQGEILVFVKAFYESDWKNQCQKAIKDHMISKCTEVQVTVTKDAAKKVSSLLATHEKSSKVPFAFDFDEDNGLVDIAGDVSLVTELQEKVTEISSSFIVTTQDVQLEPAEYEYIKQVQTQKVLKTKHPRVTITFDDGKHVLHAYGSKEEVCHLVTSLKSYSKHASVFLDTDPLAAEYLSTVGREFLDRFLKRSSAPVVATYFTMAPATKLFFLCDPREEDSVKVMAAELLEQVKTEKNLLPRSLHLNRSGQKSKLSSQFTQLYKELESKHKILCCVSSADHEVVFAGLQDGVEKAVQEMKEFLEKECTTSKELQLERLEWRLLQKNEKWESDIKKKLSDIQTNETLSHTTITLKGEMRYMKSQNFLIP